MSWWDYGYQITAMANRTILVDNNTWNNTHISRVGQVHVHVLVIRYPLCMALTSNMYMYIHVHVYECMCNHVQCSAHTGRHWSGITPTQMNQPPLRYSIETVLSIYWVNSTKCKLESNHRSKYPGQNTACIWLCTFCTT